MATVSKVQKQLQNFFQDIKGTPRAQILVLDIETIPDKEQINKWYTKEELADRSSIYSVSLGLHKVVSCGLATVTFEKGEFFIEEKECLLDLEDELSLLIQLYDKIQKYEKLVTFNGLGYDLFVLEKRVLYHGLKNLKESETRQKLRNLYFKLNKWRHEPWNHLDLFYLLDMKGQKGGLAFLLDLLCMQKHNNLKGEDVALLVQTNQISMLKEYSLQDAVLEAELFIKVVEFFRQ